VALHFYTIGTSLTIPGDHDPSLSIHGPQQLGSANASSGADPRVTKSP